MIDATPLDVIAYDSIGDVTHKVHLVLAIDVATRTLLAWRMTVGDIRAVDVVMLLNNAVTPEPGQCACVSRMCTASSRTAAAG